MSFKTLFQYRFLIIVAVFIAVAFVEMLSEQDYSGLLSWIIGDFPNRQYQLAFDFFYVYFSVVGGVSLLRKWYHERKTSDLVYIQILLPRSDSKNDQEKRTDKDFKEKTAIMAQLYRALSEITDMNWKNSLRSIIWEYNEISFEMVMLKKQLQFYIVCDAYYQSIIEKQVTALYPSAEILPSQKPYTLKIKGNSLNGFYMYTKKEGAYPLKMFKDMEEDPLNDMTNVFSKIEDNESAVIQMIISPKDMEWQKEAEGKADLMFRNKDKSHFSIIKIPIIGTIIGFLWAIVSGKNDSLKDSGTHAPGASGGDSYVRMLQPKEESIKRMAEKAQQDGFDATIRILACAPTASRVEQILNDMVVTFTVFKDPYANWFENARIIPLDFLNGPSLYHGFQRRMGRLYYGKPSILTPNELATLYHFPDSKYNQATSIQWMDYKKLPPPKNLPTEGVLLGTNSYRGIDTKVYISNFDRSRHMYILGKSGSGKSALLSFMARQDAQQGTGFCVIDPHGDLIEEVLRYVPKERAKDVIVFNPGDAQRPMGLNLLEVHSPEEKDRASLDAMQIFLKLFGNEIFGPRLQHYFRNGCLTLMDDEEEGATLLDIPRLFVDDAFQKYKVAKCRNTVVRQFWENEMANTGDREKQEMIPYFSSKFGPFVSNTTMRNIIGQPKSAFNVREVMDTSKILLVNLSKGLIGDINAQLLGLIFVNKISMAAMSRANIPEKQRVPFYLYVDEFQNFATDAFADILSEARKYKLALAMAHQYIAQLNNTQGYEKQSKLKEAVFGNVGTMVTFKMGAEDAEYFAKEYAPVLSDQDILSISNYKAYLKLSIGNAPSRPFSMGTIWDTSQENQKIADVLKEYSRMKYGRDKKFVDAEIEARLGIIK